MILPFLIQRYRIPLSLHNLSRIKTNTTTVVFNNSLNSTKMEMRVVQKRKFGYNYTINEITVEDFPYSISFVYFYILPPTIKHTRFTLYSDFLFSTHPCQKHDSYMSLNKTHIMINIMFLAIKILISTWQSICYSGCFYEHELKKLTYVIYEVYKSVH